MPLYKKKTTKDNKRKKVVKGKSIGGGSKFKSVTNKKTGLTTKTTKTKKGNYTLSADPVTKFNKRKTVQTKKTVSATSVMPMLRQLAPDSPAAKKMVAAIKKKPIAIKAKPMAKRVPKQKLAKMAKKK